MKAEPPAPSLSAPTNIVGETRTAPRGRSANERYPLCSARSWPPAARRPPPRVTAGVRGVLGVGPGTATRVTSSVGRRRPQRAGGGDRGERGRPNGLPGPQLGSRPPRAARRQPPLPRSPGPTGTSYRGLPFVRSLVQPPTGGAGAGRGRGRERAGGRAGWHRLGCWHTHYAAAALHPHPRRAILPRARWGCEGGREWRARMAPGAPGTRPRLRRGG